MTTRDRLHAIREGAQIVVAASEMALLRGEDAQVLPVLTEVLAVLESVRDDLLRRAAA